MQVARHAHVRDGDELQAGILHVASDHRRDGLQDSLLHLSNASFVSHRALLSGGVALVKTLGERRSGSERARTRYFKPCDQSRAFSRISQVSMMSPSAMSL